MPLFAPVLLAALLVALMGTAFIATWDATFGKWVQDFAQKLRGVSVPVIGAHPFARVATLLLSLAAAWRAGLGDIETKATAPLARLFWYAAKLVRFAALQVEGVAIDTGEALWRLRREIVPAMIAAKIGWIPRHLAALEAQVAGLVTRVPIHIAHTVTNVVKPTVTRIVHESVTVVQPRIRTVERESGATLKRVDNLAKRVAPAALAAAIVATIARSSFKWVRCSKVGKVGRNVCGMDSDLLDSLLADTALVAGAISLVEFAEGLQAGMDALTPQVRKFWKVTL